MLVNVEISPYSAQMKELTEEQVEQLRLIFPNVSKSGDYVYGCEGLADVDDCAKICGELGIEFTIKPHKGNVFLSRARGFEKRLTELEQDGALIRQDLLRNGTILQVHVPNFSLLNFNKVQLLSNCCTDHLQAELDLGWRILTVCPPLDERRPTYIMGKFEPA